MQTKEGLVYTQLEKEVRNLDPSPSKILLVEDDPYALRMLDRILTQSGFSVVCATNGEQALEQLNRIGAVDVVISDWMMPMMDGVELCSRIKSDEAWRLTFFVLLTSREGTGDKVRALDAGVDDYLTKPCNQEELLARIRAGLRIRSLQRELLAMEKKVAIIQVAATAGHEINNPLTGILGYLDLLHEAIEAGEGPATLLKYVDRINGQVIRIRDIVLKLGSLKEVQTKSYVGRQQILDLAQEALPDPDTE